MTAQPQERRQAELAGHGLTFTRGGTTILHDVDIELRGGEQVALTGPSGSGKTTLMSLLAGLEAPDAGTVTLDGRPLASSGMAPRAEGGGKRHPNSTALRRRVAVVFQGYALVALLTAAENVELALIAAGVPANDAGDAALHALDEVGLVDRAEHLVEELSGGQQQRVAVARALAVRPNVLLADEPTAEQDPAHRAAALEAILAAADDGAAVLLATHDPDVGRRCDRQLRIADGQLTEIGTLA
jgi:ABC-type lipoprotein export system ATPase subunit